MKASVKKAAESRRRIRSSAASSERFARILLGLVEGRRGGAWLSLRRCDRCEIRAGLRSDDRAGSTAGFAVRSENRLCLRPNDRYFAGRSLLADFDVDPDVGEFPAIRARADSVGPGQAPVGGEENPRDGAAERIREMHHFGRDIGLRRRGRRRRRGWLGWERNGYFPHPTSVAFSPEKATSGAMRRFCAPTSSP